MRVKEAMKAIDAGWIRKYKGYRVCYQRREADRLLTEYSPELEGEAMLQSEVAARRLAWKLWQATRGSGRDALVNLFVVDENNNPIPSYVTGEIEIFNASEPHGTEVGTGGDKEGTDL